MHRIKMTGFDRDVVVADVDRAIGDRHVPTIAGIDPVSVWRISWRRNGEIANDDVLALRRNEMEARRIRQRHSLHQNASTSIKLHEAGSVSQVICPPPRTGAVD